MARDLFIDVNLEIALSSIDACDRDTASRFVIERSREEADKLAESRGARVRTDRAPEFVIKRAMHPLTGDVLLVASRWAVVAPDDVTPERS